MTDELPKAFCHIYAQWDQVGDLIADESRHLFDLGLVCDATFSMDEAAGKIDTLRRIQDGGGLCAPNIYPASLDPACPDPNWWKYSVPECLRLLEIARKQFEELGLGPMRSINTYTTGNSLVEACRKTGVEFILGFCAPTVIEDGGWAISQYGSPLSPFFVSEEDFRKPENPGARKDSVFLASMELRNPLVCLNHWSEGPWCPLNAQAADRWLEPTGEPFPFLQIAEDWLRQTELSGEPKFFHVNLQYFFAGRNSEHNRRALEWLARQRDKGRLEIGGLEAWRAHLLKVGGFEKQTTYWRGEMMGFHVGHRPGCFPDVVVDESLSAQSIWEKPEPLPSRYYDYRTTWNYPEFQPDGSAPASTDFSGVKIRVAGSSVEIDNPGEPCRLPILAWDACEGLEAPFSIESRSPGWTAELIPHPTGVGGAIRLEGIASTGKSTVIFSVQGRKAQKAFTKSWPGLVEAQTFFKEGRPYTVLAAQTPERFTLTACIQREASAPTSTETEHLTGIHYEKRRANGEPMSLTFDGTYLSCWHRFWDVTADQLSLNGADETRARLKSETAKAVQAFRPGLAMSEPGYQLFGNIRDKSRWDRSLARAAGESEITKVNAWLHEQRPDAGRVVVEAHPGVFLPRGSITKVLGHEFDVIHTAPGIEFRELCADYPQGWDWGVSAWVQWRHLKVSVTGLPKSGRHQLHIHAFDPEHRNIIQQVYFFDLAYPKPRDSKCVVKEWPLPKGVENRFQSSALCSIDIPEAFLELPSLGIWIVPQGKEQLYDWVEEQGAPGLFSHLWITSKS